MKQISTLLLVFLCFSGLFCAGNPEEYAQQVYERMEIDQMKERLKPYVIRLPEAIYHMAGIKIPNTFITLNSKGEIALVSFDKEMKATFKVPAPGFPGYDGILCTDSESHYAWLRRGSGTYFLDTQTGENGHCVSMFAGSNVRQVVLADPIEKIWIIVYGQMGANLVDQYFLKDNEKKTLDGALDGQLWFYNSDSLLVNSKDANDNFDWTFTNIDFSKFSNYKDFELTKKMTKMGVELNEEKKMYNLTSRFMLGHVYINSEFVRLSIRWNKDEDEVKIEPFTPLQQPMDIDETFFVGEFSSDGKWVDAVAKHKFNGIGQPTERFIYHVGDQYPAGISPPIRLGLADLNTPGAFMLHDAWGPCYVMQDAEHPDHVLVYKLSEGMEIIAEQLRTYVPPVGD